MYDNKTLSHRLHHLYYNSVLISLSCQRHLSYTTVTMWRYMNCITYSQIHQSCKFGELFVKAVYGNMGLVETHFFMFVLPSEYITYETILVVLKECM